ncbi:MAG: hypothetical protein ACLPM3_04745 [Terracidiphilus sp.]
MGSAFARAAAVCRTIPKVVVALRANDVKIDHDTPVEKAKSCLNDYQAAAQFQQRNGCRAAQAMRA